MIHTRYVIRTGTVPLLTLECSMESLFVDIEVAMYTIEVGTQRIVILQSLFANRLRC